MSYLWCQSTRFDWRLQSTNTGVSNQTGRHTYSSQKQCAKYIGIGWFGATGKKQRTSCATCVTALSFFLNGIVEEYEGEWAIARKLRKPCGGPFLCQQAPWLQAPHLESKGPTWPAHGQLLNSQYSRMGKESPCVNHNKVWRNLSISWRINSVSD